MLSFYFDLCSHEYTQWMAAAKQTFNRVNFVAQTKWWRYALLCISFQSKTITHSHIGGKISYTFFYIFVCQTNFCLFFALFFSSFFTLYFWFCHCIFTCVVYSIYQNNKKQDIPINPVRHSSLYVWDLSCLTSREINSCMKHRSHSDYYE